jgi:hypothetical protein
MRLVQGYSGAPAVGHDLLDPSETTDDFQLITWRIQLVTSAVVANRFAHFQITDKTGTVLFEVVAQAAIAASTTRTFVLSSKGGNLSEGGAFYDGVSSLPLPDVTWKAGTHFNTKTTALDVGDQWSSSAWLMRIGSEFEHEERLEQILNGISSS